MKEIFNSVTEIAKNRLTNSLYGTFILSWLIFHWNFVFSIVALDDTKIMQFTGLLKNDYLSQKYFNFHDWYFWVSWIMPFILTYIIIWKLPKWILLKAYNKTEEYETEKRIIKISQERRVVQEEAKLEEQTAKKVTAVAKQVVEEKKIKEADPTISWQNDFNRFKKLPFSDKFSKIIESYYKHRGLISDTDEYGNRVIFEIPEDILAYAHSNEVVEIDQSAGTVNMTPKGKYFINKFLENSDDTEFSDDFTQEEIDRAADQYIQEAIDIKRGK